MDFPHGNAKNNQIYHRICPSVVEKLKSLNDLYVYKNVVSKSDCPSGHTPICMPRNSSHVANIQQKERQKFRLTHDAIYNLHELAYDLENYVKVITTYPDLVVICGLDQIIKELNLVLQLESHQPQLLSYDTTFQLGDFYVSPLLFRHNFFSTSPVIPVLFLIHERKYKRIHEEFMQLVAKVVPSLVNGKKLIPLVTDEETGIYQVRDMYDSRVD